MFQGHCASEMRDCDALRNLTEPILALLFHGHGWLGGRSHTVGPAVIGVFEQAVAQLEPHG